MKAHLTLNDTGVLVAQLETGERIVATDSRTLAEQLHLTGVTAESLTVANRKEDPDHAPTSGQLVAIRAALRERDDERELRKLTVELKKATEEAGQELSRAFNEVNRVSATEQVSSAKPRYFLKDLLAQCDVNAPAPEDMKAWEGMDAVGQEILTDGKQQ